MSTRSDKNSASDSCVRVTRWFCDSVSKRIRSCLVAEWSLNLKSVRKVASIRRYGLCIRLIKLATQGIGSIISVWVNGNQNGGIMSGRGGHQWLAFGNGY